ncbi:hypothetical protein AAHH80_38520, partial [Burkholderia pseudomallei]
MNTTKNPFNNSTTHTYTTQNNINKMQITNTTITHYYNIQTTTIYPQTNILSSIYSTNISKT